MIKKLINLSPFAFGTFFAILNLAFFAEEAKLGADTVSRALPAAAPLLNIGVPYKDYWEIIPPATPLVFSLWMRLFGFSMISFKVLHFLLLTGLVIFIYLALRKIFKGYLFSLISILIFFILFSPRLVTFLIPTEILALFFSLLGLLSLLYVNDYQKALALAGFLFVFSGQIKDPFIFSILAALPVLVKLFMENKKKFVNGAIYLLAGAVFAVLISLLYLMVLGSLADYLLVLEYKSTAFKIFEIDYLFENILFFFRWSKNVILYWQYPVVLPLVFWFVISIIAEFMKGSLKVTQRVRGRFVLDINLLVKRNRDVVNKFVVILFSLGLLIGFTTQRRLGSHYYIQIVVPLFVFLGILIQDSVSRVSQIKARNEVLKILVLGSTVIISLLLLIPKKQYFTDYQFSEFSPIGLMRTIYWLEKKQDSGLEELIRLKVAKDECIIHVYGWGVGTTYFYAQRRPCTKFFLANMVQEEEQKNQYSQDLLNNPPKAILYTSEAADLDVQNFEATIFNYSKIIEACYYPDATFENLYWSKYSSGDQRDCLKKIIADVF